MPFANLTTLYLPSLGGAGSSLWGSDVRQLLDASDAINSADTKTDHGTGTGQSVRTLDPYTTTVGDGTEANYGWAVTPSDMNSVSGALRFFPAGNHILSIRTASNQAMTSAQATYTMYIYRVGPSPTFTRTLIASASGAAFNYGAIANTYRTETVTVACPEIVLEAGETIQYSVEQSCAGVAVVGRINTHDTGTQGGNAIQIITPGLKTLAQTDGSSSGIGTASGVTQKIVNTVGSSTGNTGTATGVGASTWSTTGSAAGSGVASGVGNSTAATTGSAAGSATTTGVMGKILATVGTCEVGGGGGGTTEVDVSGKYGAAITVQTTTPSAGGVIIKCVLLILDTNSVPQKMSGTSPTPTIEVEPTAYLYEHVSSTSTEDVYLGSSGLSLISGSTDEWAGDLNTPGLTVGKDYSVIVAWKINGIQSQSKCDFRYDNTLAQDSVEGNRLVIALEPQVGEGFKFQQGVGLKIKAWLENNNGDLVTSQDTFGQLIISRVQKDSSSVQNLSIESYFGTGNSIRWYDVTGGVENDRINYALAIDPDNEYVQYFTLSSTDTQWGASPVQLQVKLRDADDVEHSGFVTV